MVKHQGTNNDRLNESPTKNENNGMALRESKMKWKASSSSATLYEYDRLDKTSETGQG
jgi:hypothetical protein